MSNGGRIYFDGSANDDGSRSLTNLERATPECATPSELVSYIRSSEGLLLQLVSNYVEHESRMRDGGTVRARIQRRNVDSNRNRKGCHDNFSVKLSNIADMSGEKVLLHGIALGHMATRSFVTGAGYVDPRRHLFFS